MSLQDLDLHLLGEGRHERLYEKLGAHVRADGVALRRLGSERERGQRGRRLQRLGRPRRTRSFSAVSRASGRPSVEGARAGDRYKYELTGPAAGTR